MFEQINNELKEALKSGDKFKLSVLRMLKSSLQQEQINKKDKLTDEEILAVIKKQVKVRKASVEEYLSYNKEDMAESLEKEIEILKVYLPEELSEEGIDKVITKVFDEVKPESIKDMGKVMKTITPLIGTRADMSEVSKKIKEKLTK